MPETKRRVALGQIASDDFLKATARIIGDQSAAARALAERDRRRGLGEDVHVFWNRDRGVLTVGPLPEGDPNA